MREGAGFTLVEVVVALLVLTVALAALCGSLGHGVAVLGAASRTRLARELVVARAVGLGPASPGRADCRERQEAVADPGPAEGLAWVWLEVDCGSPIGVGGSEERTSFWRPGRVGLLVPR